MRLEQSGSVLLDASGNGTVEILVPYSQRWRITRITVSTVIQIPPIPRCVVYRNSIAASSIVDGTYTGSQDTSDMNSPTVFEGGEKIVVRWTAGTVGDTATVNIAGTLEQL
jgi:hypothetical protein